MEASTAAFAITLIETDLSASAEGEEELAAATELDEELEDEGFALEEVTAEEDERATEEEEREESAAELMMEEDRDEEDVELLLDDSSNNTSGSRPAEASSIISTFMIMPLDSTVGLTVPVTMTRSST